MVLLVLFTLLFQGNLAARDQTVENRLQEAATLISADRLAEAEQQLNRVLRMAPHDARVFNLMGTIRAKQEKLNEAESFFRRAVQLDRNMLGAHMNLAYLYVLKSEPDKTAAELSEVLRIDPNNVDATYKLASLRLEQGKAEDAIDLVAKFKERNSLPASLLLMLGDAYWSKGDIDKAEENYLLALTTDNTSAEAILGLAQISLARGNAASALQYLNRAEELITDSPDLFYKFAVVALNATQFDKAMAAITKAIELKPQEASYYFILGVAWIKKSDLQGAEQAFRRFLKSRPDNADGQLYLGYVLLKQKKNAEAAPWIEQSVKKDGRRPEAYYYLGLIAQDGNDDEKAVGLFETAIKLRPSLANAHTALGASYLKLKNYSRAQQELESSVKLNPEDTKAHYNLAILYSRLKDAEKAKAELEILQRLKSSGSAQPAELDAVAPSATKPH